MVRWDWAGEHAAVEQPVAAVLRPQVGARQVQRIVAALYAASQYGPGDMLYAIQRDGHDPYPARFGTAPFDSGDGHRVQATWEGEVTCGHNPFLIARLATVWATGDGGIAWEDNPRPTTAA